MTTWDALTPDEREALTALLDVDIAPNFRIFESLRARGLIYEKRHPDTDELFHFLTLEGHALVEANAVAGLTETEVGEPKAGGDNDLRLLKTTGGVPRIDVPLPPASYSAEEYQSLLNHVQYLEQKLATEKKNVERLMSLLIPAQNALDRISRNTPDEDETHAERAKRALRSMSDVYRKWSAEVDAAESEGAS